MLGPTRRMIESTRGMKRIPGLKGFEMIKVKSRGTETAEQMLRRFKKMCEKEGLTKDIKRVAYYEKPSEKRRRRIRKPRPMKFTGSRSNSSSSTSSSSSSSSR
jgi:small subunit ribosomal protein S21